MACLNRLRRLPQAAELQVKHNCFCCAKSWSCVASFKIDFRKFRSVSNNQAATLAKCMRKTPPLARASGERPYEDYVDRRARKAAHQACFTTFSCASCG